MNDIQVRASRDDVRAALVGLPAAARTHGGAMMARLGLTILGRIHGAFVVKARGGVDEAGEKWKPLSPYTIARRRHAGTPGIPRFGSRNATRTPPRRRGLTEVQRTRWWELYDANRRRYRGNRAHAARMAWSALRRELHAGKHGGVSVEILRDTGLLLDSLTPETNIDEQVLRTAPGEVTVGTNRKWAGVHHHGSRDGRIPQRRLWPEPRHWPSSWWQDLLEQLQQGLIDIALQLIRSR